MFKNTHKTYLLIGLLAMILLAILTLMGLNRPNKPIPPPVIMANPSPSSLFSPLPRTTINLPEPMSKIIIGQTTDQEVQKIANIKSVTQNENNQKVYSLSSTLPARDNQIISQKGIVIFTRTVTLKPDYSYPQLKEYQNIGKPEQEISGSAYYGKFEKTFIYASKGIAIIANPYNGDVEEIQMFAPMTVDQYIQQWGQDMKTYGDLPV